MCNYCDDKTKELASEIDKDFAKILESVACHYKNLAYGHMRPHSDEFKAIEPKVRGIIRRLVEDWV